MSFNRASATAFLDGGGRMGALLRSRDWSDSPLGPPASWPDTLKVALAACLNTHFPMVIWWGPSLLLFYNDSWQPILGETKHPSALGRPGAESWPETWPVVGVQFENAFKGIASWHEDLRLASDRHGFLEECYFTYSHSPLFDAEGRIVGVCSIVSETTTRVLNERRLRVLGDLSAATVHAASESSSTQRLCEELVSLLCRDNPDATFAVQYLTGDDGVARFCASAGVEPPLLPPSVAVGETDAWGVARARQTGAPVTQPVPMENAAQLMALPLSRSTRRPNLCGVLLVGLNPLLEVDAAYSDFLKLVAAQFANAISAIQLREDERAARAEAERAARVKDEFLAMLSHELRTPLNAVLGWSAILRNDISNPDLAVKAIEIIERNALHQARLITDLLDLNRITSGQMRLDLQRIELSHVVGAAVDAVDPSAAEKGVTLRSRLEGPPRCVHGDSARLQQVMWNLLVNAIKFTPRGGTIDVALTSDDRHATIAVSDTGEGIEHALLPHIFDGFRQGDATPSRRHDGLGLGLTIVKQLIELHGGRVRASSDGTGRGAEFVIDLPLENSGAHAASDLALAPADAKERQPSLAGARILVLEDDRDALAMIRRVFEAEAAEVRTAWTVDQALTLLSRGRFDAIVSDIALPGRDGYDFMKDLRLRGLTTPAVAVTAFAHTDDRHRALDAGYQAHVAKPVDLTALVTLVAQLAQRE